MHQDENDDGNEEPLTIDEVLIIKVKCFNAL